MRVDGLVGYVLGVLGWFFFLYDGVHHVVVVEMYGVEEGVLSLAFK